MKLPSLISDEVPLILSDEGIAYISAINNLVEQYDFDTDTLADICQAAGGPENALELLGDGVPAEYILSMGGA